jgi:hypothetical protein
MYVFIDEAGNFQVPTPSHKVSCVAALVVPEPFAATLFRKFRRLVSPWRGSAREVKGSQLDERQVAEVVRLLRRFDVLVFCVCVDMGLHTDSMLQEHKQKQSEAFLRALTGRASPEMRAHVVGLAARTRSLSNQLYAQGVVLQELVAEAFRWSTLYYVQRIPKTLGEFRWVIDAKDRAITTYERLWMDAVSGLQQTRSLTFPLITMEGADYSAFSKFERVLPEAPRHLAHLVDDPAAPFDCVDIDRILKTNLKFADSHRYAGLQLVDILATSIRRACNGALQRPGWKEIGRLMLQRGRGEAYGMSGNSLRFVSFANLPEGTGLPYREVVRTFDLDAKRMLTRATSASTGPGWDGADDGRHSRGNLRQRRAGRVVVSGRGAS